MNVYLADHNEPKKAFPINNNTRRNNNNNNNNQFSHNEIRERVKRGIPPATAEEYLLRVRLEAEDYPNVTTGRAQRKISIEENKSSNENKADGFNNNNNVNNNNNNQRPRRNEKLIAWERQIVSIFRQGRQYLSRVEHYHQQQVNNEDNNEFKNKLPQLNDGYGWEYLCFGTTTQANRNVMAKLEKQQQHVDERMYEKDLENNEYDYNNNTNEEMLPSIALPKSNDIVWMKNISNRWKDFNVTNHVYKCKYHSKILKEEDDDNKEYYHSVTVLEDNEEVNDVLESELLLANYNPNDNDSTTGQPELYIGTMVWCMNDERTGWGTELYEGTIEMIEETSDYFTIKFEDDEVVDDIRINEIYRYYNDNKNNNNNIMVKESTSNAQMKKKIERNVLATKLLSKEDVERNNIISASKSTNGKKGVPPLMSIIMLLNPSSIYKLFKRHVKWLETTKLTRSKACWLYAIMYKLEKPLNGDCASIMRNLARRLLILEKKAIVEKDTKVLCSIDILLAIIGVYFNQLNML